MKELIPIYCAIESVDQDVDSRAHITIVISKRSPGIEGIVRTLRDLIGEDVAITVCKMK